MIECAIGSDNSAGELPDIVAALVQCFIGNILGENAQGSESLKLEIQNAEHAATGYFTRSTAPELRQQACD